MAIINSILSWVMKKRIHEVELFKKYPIEVQNELFEYLIKQGKNTEYGKRYHFSGIDSHRDRKGQRRDDRDRPDRRDLQDLTGSRARNEEVAGAADRDGRSS